VSAGIELDAAPSRAAAIGILLTPAGRRDPAETRSTLPTRRISPLAITGDGRAALLPVAAGAEEWKT